MTIIADWLILQRCVSIYLWLFPHQGRTSRSSVIFEFQLPSQAIALASKQIEKETGNSVKCHQEKVRYNWQLVTLNTTAAFKQFLHIIFLVDVFYQGSVTILSSHLVKWQKNFEHDFRRQSQAIKIFKCKYYYNKSFITEIFPDLRYVSEHNIILYPTVCCRKNCTIWSPSLHNCFLKVSREPPLS